MIDTLDQLIPKRLFYYWFGGKPKPDKIKKCIDSFHFFCPDWEIVERTEDNTDFYDLTLPIFVKQAIDKKKWAFVADFYRFVDMGSFGGITVDADVELLRSLESFRKFDFVSGQEVNDKVLITALMGAKPRQPFPSMVIEYYCCLERFEEIPNTRFLTRLLQLMQLKKNVIKLEGYDTVVLQSSNITLFPQETFCPFNHRTMKVLPTKHSFAVHHFQGSWK